MKMYVIIETTANHPKAYGDVFEEGDLWEHTRGCKGCPAQDRCCGNCPLKTELGCQYNVEKAAIKSKPFMCMIIPTPDMCQSWCQLEFTCTKGSRVGQIRRVKDLRDIFVE